MPSPDRIPETVNTEKTKYRNRFQSPESITVRPLPKRWSNSFSPASSRSYTPLSYMSRMKSVLANLALTSSGSTGASPADTLYEKALNGIPMVSHSVDEIADDYLSHHDTPEAAARSLARWQVAKCGTSGFLSGLGGIVTLPVTVPANIGSVIYVQMRMIAAIAKMGGYDVNSDQVQTMVYMCLTGSTIADIVKETGIQIGTKSLTAAIKKIPGSVLTKINQKIGFRFLTKFGEKGAINLGKLVPIAGGLIGGGVDVASTIVISRNAIRIFIEDEALDMSEPTEEETSDTEDTTVEATD